MQQQVDQQHPAVIAFTDEVTELLEALSTSDAAAILDEVVDVIYRAREVAGVYGVTVEMIDDYAFLKHKLRSRLGKDKHMEAHVALGVVASYTRSEP